MKTTKDFFPANPMMDETKVIRLMDIVQFNNPLEFINEARELNWRLIACSVGRLHFVFGEEILDSKDE
jgi:hypothetical protein